MQNFQTMAFKSADESRIRIWKLGLYYCIVSQR